MHECTRVSIRKHTQSYIYIYTYIYTYIHTYIIVHGQCTKTQQAECFTTIVKMGTRDGQALWMFPYRRSSSVVGATLTEEMWVLEVVLMLGLSLSRWGVRLRRVRIDLIANFECVLASVTCVISR